MVFKMLEKTSLAKLLILGTVIRLLMMLYSAFHDAYFRVKYTDIDYAVITDGAAAMVKGGSPFERATFRYTPILSALMIPNVLVWHHLGKVLFCLCDIGAAYYSAQILRTFVSKETTNKLVALFILFNPIVINVSTRGNSDMVITFMSLVVVAKFIQGQTMVAALWLGFAAHFKLYPVIYAAALVAGLYHRIITVQNGKYITFIAQSIGAGVACVIGFVIPTVLCHIMYDEYLFEALIYHFGRADHRHNLSPYFYVMYLNMSVRPDEIAYNSTLIAFVPQILMLALVGWRLRKNVAQAVCIETILFVAFNKVCTVQYFVWFIPFLPFVFAELLETSASTTTSKKGGNGNDKKKVVPQEVLALTSKGKCIGFSSTWFVALIMWMLVAMQLEFNGHAVFLELWVCSCAFFAAQIGVAAWLAKICLLMQNRQGVQTK